MSWYILCINVAKKKKISGKFIQREKGLNFITNFNNYTINSYDVDTGSEDGSSTIERNFDNPPASKNVTLVRAERESVWNYDKYERRHRSTNVLTFKVSLVTIEFNIFSRFITV